MKKQYLQPDFVIVPGEELLTITYSNPSDKDSIIIDWEIGVGL